MRTKKVQECLDLLIKQQVIFHYLGFYVTITKYLELKGETESFDTKKEILTNNH